MGCKPHLLGELLRGRVDVETPRIRAGAKCREGGVVYQAVVDGARTIIDLVAADGGELGPRHVIVHGRRIERQTVVRRLECRVGLVIGAVRRPTRDRIAKTDVGAFAGKMLGGGLYST